MLIDISHIEGVRDVELMSLIVTTMNWIINFSAVVTVVMIISAGFQYMVSAGDAKKISKATSSLVFAIVGMILVFLAPAIIQFVLDNFLN